MEFLGVVEGEAFYFKKRRVWKLMEKQDRKFRSYYAQRDGLGGDKAGNQGRGRGR